MIAPRDASIIFDYFTKNASRSPLTNYIEQKILQSTLVDDNLKPWFSGILFLQHVHTIEEPKFVAAPPAYENVIADDTFFGQSSFQQETPVAESSFSMPPPYFSTYETTMAPASDLNISVSTDLNINVSTDRDVNGATEFNINVAPATGNM